MQLQLVAHRTRYAGVPDGRAVVADPTRHTRFSHPHASAEPRPATVRATNSELSSSRPLAAWATTRSSAFE